MARKKKAVRRKKAAAGSVGLSARQVCEVTEPRARELSAEVDADGGAVLGSYSDPFGGTWVRRRSSDVKQEDVAKVGGAAPEG